MKINLGWFRTFFRMTQAKKSMQFNGQHSETAPPDSMLLAGQKVRLLLRRQVKCQHVALFAKLCTLELKRPCLTNGKQFSPAHKDKTKARV